jgi:meso-butanediol dehydrogenase/(S,S)-butanediol dehydrogenase/diacetyl reductase
MKRLLDKVAIITGAGMGIGKAIAELFSEEGATVVLVDTDTEAGQSAVSGIAEKGGRAIFVPCDVSNSGQVSKMVQAVIQSMGRIDILINNAGITASGTVIDTSEEVWDKVIGVNLKGIFLCSKYAIPHMINGGGGTVVNIASVAGLTGLRRGAAYNASKGGAIKLAMNMALDFAEDGIRVNTVCPGATLTPMYEAGIARSGDAEEMRAKMTRLRPMNRLANAHEIAHAVLFLASSESSCVTGAVLVADCGTMAQFSGQVRPGAGM